MTTGEWDDELKLAQVQLETCMSAASAHPPYKYRLLRESDYGWTLLYRIILALRDDRDHLAAESEQVQAELKAIAEAHGWGWFDERNDEF